ncbi:MAG: gliding motility-associated C-terminal domain-containing protein, partial [Saprospiraceae bacterium]
FHEFRISLPELADAGCLPPGLALQPGDSLLFRGDFVFRQNFTPNATAAPPLVNFRNTVCGKNHIFAWQLANCFPPLLRQYSGYIERIRPPVYSILPCSTSTEIFPFRYTMRIARANMFPKEVRPLAWLYDYSHSLPNVNLLETRLKFLRLQENTALFNNQLLPVVQLDNALHVDLNPFFDSPLDEGFSLEIGTLFAPDCAFTGPLATSTELQVRYPNAGFHTPVVQQNQLSNLNGYVGDAPALALEPAATTIEISTEQLALNFVLRNLSPAASPHTWLAVSATGNGLSNMEIVLLPSGQSQPLIGGIFQLGTIGGFNQPQFQLRGTLDVCEPISITFLYGWDCEPVTNLAGQSCGNYTQTIQLIPQSPELELVVEPQTAALKMCTPSEWFTFQIYNAAEGRAYEPVGSIKLPPGLMVLAGSSQISVPTGSAWMALSDPLLLPGNVYEWSPVLPNGLPPFMPQSQNGLQIRFRVLPTCGFVANSQPIYAASCRKPCGLSSNTLRKPGQPLQLEGLEPDYGVEAQLSLADPNSSTSCGETTGLSAVLDLGGVPTPGDSVFVLLPAGVSYVAGSYQPGPNAPTGPPQVTSQGLQLPLPPGLAAGSELRFTFSVRYDAAAGCSDQTVVLQTRERSQAFCPLTNENCSVYVATGEAILFLKVINPDLLLQNFTASVAGSGVGYQAVLENAGAGTAKNPLLQFFLDQNHNGEKDANEPTVGLQQINGTLLPAALLSITGNLQITPAQLCDLAAFLPADANCSCTDRVLPLGGQATILQAIGLCGLASVPLQVDSVTGSTYAWLTPQGLACSTCTHTTYTPPSGVQSGDLVTLVLEEKTTNCTIQHQFDLQFGGNLGVETEDQIICRGESVSLQATPGGAYVWSGPGITNPTLVTQTLQPTQNASYSVTVTFPGGCTGTEQVAVTVLPGDSLDLGVIRTCLGQPVDVFGQLTDKPGLYSQWLPKANGCDSVLYVRLQLVPTETSELRPLCAGDSTMVFDSLFYTAGSLCRTFSSTAGCDSTHCVTVMPVANPVIPAQDSLVIGLGQEIILDGPDGYSAYVWLPAAGLSCSDCADPLAQPDSTTNYLLVVADDHGCLGSVLYRVLVFPPCDPHRLLIPNAFTPNGDGLNDTFSVVPFEGIESVLELTIFDRWGGKVYVGSGATAAWDGTIDGRPAPADVYVYQLVVDCNGERTPLTMEVTLLR